ncbi:M50 family metallopeptidase [Actinomyces wuliandei]|uniref:M50 family metallopeptidase n=1 Tax=Actinomyces wuliandei TaxID=2057743 RepID=UPI001FA9F238|nr:M50 family metallopeptidase [Actinomyces wuliandei]
MWVALVVLAVVLTWPPARRWGRTLVTIVHEAGHAGVGVLVGRRFLGFVVDRDLSGHAVTSGPARGPGRVLTTWAGYPAPAVLGALVALAALRGWAGPVLVAAVAVMVVLLVMSRSVRTAGLVVLVGVLAAALWWWGGPWRAGAVAGTGMAMLVGAWDSLRDVARTRDPGQDHRTLAQLTPLPAGAWLVTWFLVDAAATAAVVLAVQDLWQVPAL